MSVNLPLINGHRYSFASLELMVPFAGKRYIGFKGITYDDSLEPGKVYGAAPNKLGRTRGKADSTGSLELYLDEFNDFAKLLVGTALARGFLPGVGIMEVSFDLVVAYAEVVPASVQVDGLIGCRITKIGKPRNEGTDALSVPCTLDIMQIDHNGIPGTSELITIGT